MRNEFMTKTHEQRQQDEILRLNILLGKCERECAELRKALEAVTGKEADGVAHDLDHGNFHRNKWWRAVLRARRVLKRALTPQPQPEKI